jgi:formiminotetrahydrofolate cyclodeaminase
MGTPEETSIAHFAEAVAAATPAPGGGAVAAVTAALAAALTEMVAGLAVARASGEAIAGAEEIVQSARRIRSRLLALASEDESAFRAVIEARRTRDERALEVAWAGAARVPAELVRVCRDLAQLACRAARSGPPAALGDAVMAALLATAAAAGSHVNLRLNVQAAGGPAGLRVLADATSLVLKECQRAATETRMLAEERLVGRPGGSVRHGGSEV